MGDIDLGDMHFRNGRVYSPWRAYGQSKTANILFAKVWILLCLYGRPLHNISLCLYYAQELSSQLKGTGVTAVSVHPGVIATNLFAAHNKAAATGVVGALFRTFIVDKSIPQGAATTLYACLEPTLAQSENRGTYLADCAIKQPSTVQAQDADGSIGRALWASTDAQLQAALALESTSSGANEAKSESA